MNGVRVLLVDDHALVRSGLESLMGAEPDLDVVGSASDGAQALELVVSLAPDVVLMDLSMPVLDGVAATRRLTAEHPGTAVLVLTSFSDRERVTDALDAGAVGYVLKDSEPSVVLEAVRAVARGESPLDPRVARTLLAARRADPAAELTDREREVLGLVGRGLPNKQIARALGIRESTVKAHLTSVFAAIGVRDRTAAALWAQRNLSG
ncbi:DNA-binding NarL/FixJ family response regulator [Motilibacter peucedani]|uniref:DNA-binding NarL/FixJ family response regulator n=1 Tax=Motilibacter peucedani TaxID=598650 RepID=A0A420XTD5_9ACTN|nr:response regulator transcription factor [Motilibacter peucedani]RKS80093.1 DNA-binding NarL/FixJ family response regulator [Motilibacter peucedani]